ncbi:MAG TPA: ARMT1-like domain-containing protein [Candidatus Aminicenantes bacterium]|nr:ARMT1-like domain-containing protein [Candidatus Aminicenantes bacterium]
MKTSLDCLPCFVRQALDAARMVSTDPAFHERFLREILARITEMSLDTAPAVFGRELHRRIRGLSGREDPYREAKERQNRLALALMPGLREKISAAPDPLILAARLAAAGNVIDLGAPGPISETNVRESIAQALTRPLAGEGNKFREEVLSAKNILYLADNAGEIVMDRLFIEQLGPSRVTVAVRGGPILNDATRADARATGLDEIVEIIDNGSDAPGTLLEDCSPEFRRRFEAADLVLAKGQGNFETLAGHPKNIVFLFKIKCPVIAAEAGAPAGAHVVIRSAGEQRGLL